MRFSRIPTGAIAVVLLLLIGLLSGPVGFDPGEQSAEAAWLNEVKRLIASDAEASDEFGLSVAVSGDIAIVGADREDAGGSNAGAAYVFQRNQGDAGNWGQVKKLIASDAAGGASFGVSVAVDGDTAIVGADYDRGAGAAYVFERDEGGAGNWGEVKKLIASDAEALDFFGQSAAISGDTIVVGAYGEDVGGSLAGAAYVFERDEGGAGNWGEVKKLIASDAEVEDRFGWSVAANGDTAAVGAYGEDSEAVGAGAAGAAYIFEDYCASTPWPVPDGDNDCDGFTTAAEGAIGTNSADACADTPTPNDEADDKWPPDFDDNRVVNTTDVFQLLPPYFGTSVPPTSVRRDLFPDGVINTTDVFRVLPPFLGSSCAP